MTTKMTRRAFASMALAAPLVIRSGTRLSAQTLREINYITPYGNSTVYAPDYVAITNGYFEEQGLKVNLIPGNGSSASVQQLLAGQVQIARTGGLDLIAALSTGNAPIRAFGTIAHTSTWWIISGADAPIETPEDFRGKTIGIVSAGGGSEKVIDILLAGAGVPKDEVTFQVVGNSPGSMDLIEMGRLDGFIGDMSVWAPLNDRGAPMHAMSLDPYMDVPGQVYFTTNEMLETDPDVCLAYMRAVKKAVQVIEADETGAASIEAMMPFAFPELDTPEAATLTLQAEKELWVARGDEGIGKIYPEAFAKGWEQMAAANLSDPDMDPSVAYTTAISDQL
ncbi:MULTISPECIES: ABC transporter substrate-binding protein [Salipiger]|uniref:ABC transporter substrate-binding protein n=1 Tax=Salipiger TaxID=263377 RepID=UPI000C979F55|nr:ABC transporter substrate-binding protein [Salipiger bermudensis]MAE89322.1 hypothetical protein [Pelagibaca sp.]MBR9891246.1 ABC transporter substrate-binding protein [bacterium]MCA1283896.1 ABC transporter substrate-binding protein [Salipiger bermudensis]